MDPKTKLLNLRVTDDFNDRLGRASNFLQIPYSQIVREAVAEKLDALEAQHPEIKKRRAKRAA